MVISKNATFRRKHRPLWYGMLCLVLVTAAVSTVSLIPSQSNDISSAESVDKYVLTDGDKNILESSDVLEEIMKFINDSDEYFVFTIIVNGDDTIFNELTLDEGKEVTLTSSSDKTFTLNLDALWECHFVVSGTLTLENIILDGGKDGKYYNNLGGGIEVNASGTLIMKDGVIIQNCYNVRGGGVYIDGGTFIMNGGEISNNHAGSGSVYVESGTFTMNNGKIINNISSEGGGGVYVAYHSHEENGEFTMNGGVISGNKAVMGGGVYNSFKFTMNGGVISGNVAEFLGGGVCTPSEVTIINGVISDNAAELGGGIFATYYEKLTVKDGVIFSGNTAFTLRTQNDVNEETLAKIVKISDKVMPSAPANPKLNAPLLNNFDINYEGDAYVVTIDIVPNGGGKVVDVKYEGNDTVWVKEYVYVPLAGDRITISVTPNKGYEFVQMKISEDLKTDEYSFTFDVEKNMTVSVEFLHVSTQPEKPEKDYFITASADESSTISPSGTVTVPFGENKTFLFSAKPGYQIKAVYVNGVAISSAELASGAYTFSKVMSNHTISVVSEVEVGSGGDIGDGGSDGTGSGPDVSGSDNLFVIGIICAILVISAGAIVFVWRRGYLGSHNE